MEQEHAPALQAGDATITGVSIACVYVDDFAKAFEFYSGLLGLKKKYDMGEQACYFEFEGKEWGLYLDGGNDPSEITVNTSRASFMLSVPSSLALHTRLVAAGVRCVQNPPQHMGGGDYWFQFFDPAGNIIEVLGGE
ncbi:MAG TPA: VOC family protein [Candidatus Kapabacteria bacterium]|nr:VOC family protein [Candidatus Kapabacteria bacterium]